MLENKGAARSTAATALPESRSCLGLQCTCHLLAQLCQLPAASREGQPSCWAAGRGGWGEPCQSQRQLFGVGGVGKERRHSGGELGGSVLFRDETLSPASLSSCLHERHLSPVLPGLKHPIPLLAGLCALLYTPHLTVYPQDQAPISFRSLHAPSAREQAGCGGAALWCPPGHPFVPLTRAHGCRVAPWPIPIRLMGCCSKLRQLWPPGNPAQWQALRFFRKSQKSRF